VQAYEIVIILDPETDEERQEEIIGRVRDIILADGGSWDAVDPWGRKKLAYEIDKKTDGAYWMVRASATAAALAEFERVLRITDEVIRHKSVIRPRPAKPAKKQKAGATEA